MTNFSKTLYIGITSDLVKRIYEHKNKMIEGFTRRYNITKLVYFEETNDVNVAIQREKQLKGWLRKKKIALIESVNPSWRDLSEDFFEKGQILRHAFGLAQNDKINSRLSIKPH